MFAIFFNCVFCTFSTLMYSILAVLGLLVAKLIQIFYSKKRDTANRKK